MTANPKTTRVEVTTFEFTLEDVGADYNTFNMVYEPGGRSARRSR